MLHIWIPITTLPIAEGEHLLSCALSPRERVVLDALLEAKSNKEIASKLSSNERAIKFHVSNIMHKMGLKTRTQVMQMVNPNGRKC